VYFNRVFLMLGALALLFHPVSAHAGLPAPVRELIEAAIQTGDADKVAIVVDLARQTNPDDLAEIDTIYEQFQAGQQQLAEREEAQKLEKIRSAGLFDNWSGKGEIGASRSTGNSSETGIAVGLALERRGIDWRHKLKALADYQRSDGETTKEQFLFAYEPNYTITDGLFAFGLTQYERDHFQGFSSRISASGGLGYRVFDRPDLQLSVKTGPAWRRTSLIPAGTEEHLAGLGALSFEWQFAENLKLTEEASAFVEADNSTLTSLTGLSAKLNGNLSARISYGIEHETDPPAGAVKTDTLSRFTLIYDF